MNKKVILAGVVLVVLTIGIGAGVYFGVNRNQDIRSKATGTCAPIGWLENPGPANGATNVSTTPDFSWTFERGLWGQVGDWINIYVWRCPEMVDSCKSIFHTKFETSGPVYSISWAEAGKVDPLDCNQTYWWQAYVSDSCIGPMVPNATWHFTTGCPPQQVSCNQTCDATHLCPSDLTCDTTSGTCRNSACSTQISCVCPVTPPVSIDCVSLTTTADLNNLQIGQLYTFSLTVSGPATSIVMPVYFDNSCTTLTNNTAPYRASGPGTYTTSWRPTRAGPFVAYGQVNAGTTSCQADCGGTLCAGAASCKLTGTVKTQTVGCNQTCKNDSDCDSGYCFADNPTPPMKRPTILVCRNRACETQTSCVCPVTPPVAACQKVTASKDLTTIKIGDTVTFSGYGTLVGNDVLDKVNFRILKNDVEVDNKTVDTVLDPASQGTTRVYNGVYQYTVASAGSYSVIIKVHQKDADKWLE